MDKFCPDKHARIFDVGCGTGDNLGFLAAHGRVTAMEKHDTALAYARARNIGNVYEGNLPDGIPDEVGGDYDIIVMFDVLEHIEDDARCLSILLEHAKGKGKLILTVPAYRFLWSNHDVIHHHKRRYTSANLRKALEANGWRVNYISYCPYNGKIQTAGRKCRIDHATDLAEYYIEEYISAGMPLYRFRIVAIRSVNHCCC